MLVRLVRKRRWWQGSKGREQRTWSRAISKEAKSENENGKPNGKDAAEIAAEFEEFCKAIKEHLSIQQMREILEANGEDSSGPDSAIVSKWLFFDSHLIKTCLRAWTTTTP